MDGTKIKLERIADLGPALQKMIQEGSLDGFLDDLGQYLIDSGIITKLYKHTVQYGSDSPSYAYFITSRKDPYVNADMYSKAPKEAFASWCGPLSRVTSISQSGPTTISAYGISSTGQSSSYALNGTFVSDTVEPYNG